MLEDIKKKFEEKESEYQFKKDQLNAFKESFQSDLAHMEEQKAEIEEKRNKELDAMKQIESLVGLLDKTKSFFEATDFEGLAEYINKGFDKDLEKIDQELESKYNGLIDSIDNKYDKESKSEIENTEINTEDNIKAPVEEPFKDANFPEPTFSEGQYVDLNSENVSEDQTVEQVQNVEVPSQEAVETVVEQPVQEVAAPVEKVAPVEEKVENVNPFSNIESDPFGLNGAAISDVNNGVEIATSDAVKVVSVEPTDKKYEIPAEEVSEEKTEVQENNEVVDLTPDAATPTQEEVVELSSEAPVEEVAAPVELSAPVEETVSVETPFAPIDAPVEAPIAPDFVTPFEQSIAQEAIEAIQNAGPVVPSSNVEVSSGFVDNNVADNDLVDENVKTLSRTM